mgnify:FL=1
MASANLGVAHWAVVFIHRGAASAQRVGDATVRHALRVILRWRVAEVGKCEDRLADFIV